MRTRISISKVCLLVMCLTSVVIEVNADFYPQPFVFVESSYMTSGQVHPDLAFDGDNTLHVVWSGDPTSEINRIFHRKIDATGMMYSTEPVLINGSCETVDCGLDYPSLAIANSRCTVVFPGSASHPSIDSSELNTSTGVWTFTGEADDGSSGPYPEVAVASYGDYVILAYHYQDGIRFVRCHNGVWEPASEYLMLPVAGVYFNNVDIAIDADGYFYTVFDILDTNTSTSAVYAGRSTSPVNPFEAFLSFRAVEPFHSEVFQSFPSISVTGAASTSDLAVTIGWVHLDTGSPVVYAQTELNGLWSTMNVFIGTGSRACSWTTGVVAKHVDVVRDADGVVRMVWLDMRIAHYEVYGSVSFNNTGSFLPDECVSCVSGYLEPAADPAIAVSSGPGKTTAIAYSRMYGANQHVYLSHENTLLYDSCGGDFSNWDTASGVTVDPLFGHDPGGGSFKFITSGKRGLLVNDFTPDYLTGTIDFWFYDSMSNTSDFSFKIDGDDGLRAGVYRMIGINNASSHTAYSAHDGTNGWTVTSAMRFTGWHHVITSVREDRIEMFIDPDLNPMPVLSNSGFQYFHRIEFEGGTDGEPYFLDDVHLITEILRATPSLSIAGIVVMLLAFTGVMRLRR